MGANEVVVLFDPTKPLDTDYVLCIACDTIEQLMQESGQRPVQDQQTLSQLGGQAQ